MLPARRDRPRVSAPTLAALGAGVALVVLSRLAATAQTAPRPSSLRATVHVQHATVHLQSVRACVVKYVR